MCVHALKARIFGDSQQVLGAALPGSAGSTSCAYASIRDESGRGAPTRSECWSPLSANHHPHGLAFVIAIGRHDVLALALALALEPEPEPALARAGHSDGHDYDYDYGRNALDGWASGANGMSSAEDQDAIGGAGTEDGHLLGRVLR